VVDALGDDTTVQRLEPELGASRGEWLDDARDIVADEHEPSNLGVRLHCSPQRVLRILVTWHGGTRETINEWPLCIQHCTRPHVLAATEDTSCIITLAELPIAVHDQQISEYLRKGGMEILALAAPLPQRQTPSPSPAPR